MRNFIVSINEEECVKKHKKIAGKWLRHCPACRQYHPKDHFYEKAGGYRSSKCKKCIRAEQKKRYREKRKSKLVAK